MIGTFDANHPVALTFPCTNEQGVALTVTAATYSVVDEVGGVVVASMAVPGFVASAPQVDITVTAAQNALTAGVIEAVRKVIVVMTTATGSYTLSQFYVIEAETILLPGVNSVQTYEQAILASRHVSDLFAWSGATERAQRTALLEAYGAMSNFLIRSVTESDSLVGVADESLISELEADDLTALDDRLIMALRKTQVAQADFIMTRISTERLMRDGVQSQTVGESSQFFSPRPVLKLPLCKKALEFLGPWMIWRVGLGRA